MTAGVRVCLRARLGGAAWRGEATRRARFLLESMVGDPDRGERSLWVLASTPAATMSGPEADPSFPARADAAFRADAAASEGLGWVGWVAYEAAPAFDRAFVPIGRPIPLPLVWFERVEVGVVSDASGAELVVEAADASTAAALLAGWRATLEGSVPTVVGAPDEPVVDGVAVFGPPKIPDEAWHAAAHATIREALRDGRVYQACLTFPIECAGRAEVGAVYAALRAASPGDYAALIRTPQLEAASVSPERFLEVRDGWVTARPMKGTRARGGADDAVLAEELRGSPKERAENVMIVDLMRNDLGRVCEAGSIGVPALFEVETYRTVLQMTSTVRGRLRPEVGPFALLGATFPPGSMTGAPKVEACRLLRELEPEPRGLYAGTIGWLGYGGRWTFSVVIRTAQRWGAGGRWRWNVGGGIVWGSTAEGEWAEALAKARALFAVSSSTAEG